MIPEPPSSHPPGVVWITGAAGGLGCVLVEEFLGAGWRVAASHHNSPLPKPFEGVFSPRINAEDVTSVEQGVQAILERFGRLDAMVHSAGLIRDGLLCHLNEEDWDRVVSANLRSAFLCCRSVVSPMVGQGGGHIVLLGSFAARRGHAGQSNYVAAKAGLVGLGQSLAAELGPSNVRVNSVFPGVLRTAMTSGLNPAQLAALAASNCLNRINDPGEVARFVRLLAGMNNVSGQVFQLDSRISRWT